MKLMQTIIKRAFGLRGVFTLLALMLTLSVSAQNKITGRVVDETDQPAIGANVVIAGTTQGVSTDVDGRYAISAKKGQVLVFSYLGYKNQEVPVNAQTQIDVKLEAETNVMDEVVVVGYGSMKRSDLTTEGQCLNHCVGGQAYFERHILGHQMVFFIRKVSAPDKPYFTAEIDTDTGRIIQLYGFGDCSAPKEVRDFTEGFARAVLRWQTVGLERKAG